MHDNQIMAYVHRLSVTIPLPGLQIVHVSQTSSSSIMGFGNLASDAGLATLDSYLLDKSYIDG